jgi:hypothetical protein
LIIINVADIKDDTGHMAGGLLDEALKSRRYDRQSSLAAFITGAAGVLCIVFARADWSHLRQTVMPALAINSILYFAGLIFLTVTFILWLWLRTHDAKRIRYFARMGTLVLAM